MPTPTSFRMGPGTVKLGVAGVQNISIQVTSFTVQFSESVETTAAVPVITGDELPAEETPTVTWSVAGNVIQDLAAAGVVAYSWTNAKAELDLEFIPNTAAARKVTGTIVMVPINLGGDAKTRPQSDFTWRGKAGTMPVLANV